MDIQQLRNEGLSKAAAARHLGIDRRTVSKHWEGSAEEIAAVRYKSRGSKVDPYLEYIIDRLERYPELSAQRFYQDISKQGYNGSARTVRRMLSTMRPQDSRSYKPMLTLPGEQAQVDWGHFGTLVEHGKRLKLYAFVFTLSWSRAMYVEFITSLNMATFAGSLHRALASVGGVPTQILFDNAKTIVSDRVGSIVRFNQDLLHLALRYSFTPKACWVADPESKGRVESNVKYVRWGFFYGLEFHDRADLNGKARTWLTEIANQRTHGTTGEIPAQQLSEEQAYLQPFVPGEGPLGVLEDRQVSKDSVISIDQNIYSVPSHLRRQKIRIRRFEDAVEVLDADQVVHRHTLQPGKRRKVIVDEHYPEHQRPRRRSHPLQERFEALCPQAATYLQGLGQARVGTLREQMERIVSLGDTYSVAAMDAAMARSLEFGAFGYGRLKRILGRQEKAPTSLPSATPNGAQKGSNGRTSALQRDPSYYAGVIS